MATTGFKIKDDFDIEVQNGLFVFVRNRFEVAQRIKHELLTLKGEVREDTERGLDLLGIMLSETSSKSQRKDEIIRCLSYIPEVEVLDIIEILEDRVAKYFIRIRYNGNEETITFEVQ